MLWKRIFLARNEKKYQSSIAQSTLEYALIFPMLFILILGIMELAFLWHDYNSVEFAAREISANVALSNLHDCISEAQAKKIVEDRTAILQFAKLSFNSSKNAKGDVMTFASTAKNSEGTPLVTVKIDCSKDGKIVHSGNMAPIVQVRAVHFLHFFIASFPNFRTGKRIIIIPESVNLTSTKIVTMARE